MQSFVANDSRKRAAWSITWFNWRMWSTAVCLLAIFVAGLAYLQYATPGLVGNDGYYHIKMGYLIRTQGLKPPFPYLPNTILTEPGSVIFQTDWDDFTRLFFYNDKAVYTAGLFEINPLWQKLRTTPIC